MLSSFDIPAPNENSLQHANEGNAKAQFEIAWYSYVKKNYKEAEYWSLKSAEQGHVGSQLLLGILYSKGILGKIDIKSAADWYLKAANLGNAQAQFSLGIIEDNQGNFKEALHWYQKAADQDHILAQSVLGKLYVSGTAVPKNFIKAGEWFKKAAENGYHDAQFNLGVMYDNGEGFLQNHTVAAEWYRRAAAQGHGDAQYNLGTMYADGIGVAKDSVLAYVLFDLAASNKDFESNNSAIVDRDFIQKLLNISQLEEALLLSKNTQRPVIGPTEEKHCSAGLYHIPTISKTGSVHKIKNP